MRNAEYPPSPFLSFRHPKGCLFMFGARADNRTAFCAAKTWFAETAEKETFSDREVASKQRIAGTASAVAIRRGAAYPPSPFSSFRHPKGCLFMFGARADNRTAFCAAKTWFAVVAATARSRCGLRSREYTKFSVKRPRRSENSGTHRTHPRRRCLFLHGTRADNRTAFSLRAQIYLSPSTSRRE